MLNSEIMNFTFLTLGYLRVSNYKTIIFCEV